MAEFNISINGEPGQVDAAVRRLLGLPVASKVEVTFLDEPAPTSRPWIPKPEDVGITPEPESSPETQKCQRCGEVKPLGEFGRSSVAKSGRTRTCHTCYAAAQKAAQGGRRKVKREPKSPPEDDQHGDQAKTPD
jgi:hypothetical protein